MTENKVDSGNTTAENSPLNIIEVIKKVHLFEGLKDAVQQKLADECTGESFKFNEVIWSKERQQDWNYQRNKNKKNIESDTPLMIVASGCAAVTQSSGSTYQTHRLNALVMPYQLIGEFQFLGDPWPPDIEIRAFATTEVIFLDPKILGEFAKEYCSIIYKNLAETLMEKLNIANYHFLITGGKDVMPKLAMFLDKVFKIPNWDLICKIDQGGNGGHINIFWNYTTLGHLLNCDGRSVRPPVEKLVADGVISLTYFDLDMNKVEAPKNGGVKANKAYFQITLHNKKALRRHIEQKRSGPYK